jgi:hypothetical protein
MNIIDIEIDWKLSLEIIMKEFRSDNSMNAWRLILKIT